MENLLFLSHRVPYPPTKGDKIRSYHVLRHLARSYRLFLGTFVDDPADWRHLDALREICAEVHVEPLAGWSRAMPMLRAVLAGEALSLHHFRSQKLALWVEDVARRERIERAYVFSSPMAQYVADLPQVRTVVDFVDMDSAKWADYAQRRPWPISALFRREAARLLAFERDVAARSEASIFVTEGEAQLFRRELANGLARIVAIRNGVDSAYFAPTHDLVSPFQPGECPVVFTGAMDYWPNKDAAMWFAREVLPRIRGRDPAVRFYVVGMNPSAAVCALARDSGVVVTGRVDDVRPYLQHARVVVAPLRVARGIQNKVLEAMAMAKPVVVTAESAAALSVGEGIELEVASGAEDFAAKVLGLLEPRRAEAMGTLARARVLKDFVWQRSLALLDGLLSANGCSAETAAPPGGRVRLAMTAR